MLSNYYVVDRMKACGSLKVIKDHLHRGFNIDSLLMTLMFLLPTGDSFRVVHKPRLHKEFKAALKDLPKTFSPENKQRFYKLIDTYGTHYITQVKIGLSPFELGCHELILLQIYIRH